MGIKNKKPQIIKGGIYEDPRGTIRYANDFRLTGIKRFYVIEHNDTRVVRAWQGHRKEEKYFFPIKGKFLIAWVNIDDFENPDKNLKAEYQILEANNTLSILYLPAGYGNGFKALESHSILGIFSNLETDESNRDIVRYPAGWWFDWDIKLEKNGL